jgi:hypothetical protein
MRTRFQPKPFRLKKWLGKGAIPDEEGLADRHRGAWLKCSQEVNQVLLLAGL